MSGQDAENPPRLAAAALLAHLPKRVQVSLPKAQYKEHAVMRATHWAAVQSSKWILVSRNGHGKYREAIEIFKYCHFPAP